jgi:hypothetical protein
MKHYTNLDNFNNNDKVRIHKIDSMIFADNTSQALRELLSIHLLTVPDSANNGKLHTKYHQYVRYSAMVGSSARQNSYLL